MQKQQTQQQPSLNCLVCSYHLLEPDANPLYFRLYCQRYKRYSACEKTIQEIELQKQPRWCKKSPSRKENKQ